MTEIQKLVETVKKKYPVRGGAYPAVIMVQLKSRCQRCGAINIIDAKAIESSEPCPCVVYKVVEETDGCERCGLVEWSAEL